MLKLGAKAKFKTQFIMDSQMESANTMWVQALKTSTPIAWYIGPNILFILFILLF